MITPVPWPAFRQSWGYRLAWKPGWGYTNATLWLETGSSPGRVTKPDPAAFLRRRHFRNGTGGPHRGRKGDV